MNLDWKAEFYIPEVGIFAMQIRYFSRYHGYRGPCRMQVPLRSRLAESQDDSPALPLCEI